MIYFPSFVKQVDKNHVLNNDINIITAAYYLRMKNTFFNSIDIKKLISLLVGIVVIYFTFLIGGVFHQYILKQKYVDRFDGKQNYFNEVAGLIAVQKAIVWIFGLVYNLFALKKQSRKTLPIKNNLFCALTVFLSSITNNYAMILVSYPIVVMFKSCNILSVILVGVLCSRVTDKSLKLGKKKIIVALLVTIGIIMFKIFDPEAKGGADKKVQIMGLVFLVISLLADGFLPDFQAQIKQKYNPQPTVMMVQINKWCFFVSAGYLIISGHLISFAQFTWRHPLFAYHLILIGFLAFIGQIFIYRMIKDFKQYIVPFVITTRKIVSVGISMVYFRHPTNIMQLISIVLVFGTTLFEFINEVLKPKKKEQIKQYKKFLKNSDADQSRHLNHQLNAQTMEKQGENQIYPSEVNNTVQTTELDSYQIQPQLQQP